MNIQNPGKKLLLLLLLALVLIFVFLFYWYEIPVYSNFTKTVSSFEQIEAALRAQGGVVLPSEEMLEHVDAFELLMNGRDRSAQPVGYQIYGYQKEECGEVEWYYFCNSLQRVPVNITGNNLYRGVRFSQSSIERELQDGRHYLYHDRWFTLEGRYYRLDATIYYEGEATEALLRASAAQDEALQEYMEWMIDQCFE